MYDNYSFVLEWNDLPEDLREQKIDEYITHTYDDEHDVEEGDMTLEEAIQDFDNRRNAERQIEARFPMYF